jgi:hypothetical protein
MGWWRGDGDEDERGEGEEAMGGNVRYGELRWSGGRKCD